MIEIVVHFDGVTVDCHGVRDENRVAGQELGHARGHRGPAHVDVTVQLIEQPPYSPELNPSERVFEYLRSKVEGRVYDTMDAK